MAGNRSSTRATSIVVALLGMGFMAAICAGLIMPQTDPYIGSHLYDLYAKTLLSGRFDMPAMDLRYEGHFTPDGTGYLYYGLGPLLTRLPFLPFVDMPTTWISAVSIWFWAVLGTAAYHRAFWLGLSQGMGGDDKVTPRAALLLALAAWFTTPGILVAGGGAVFHEPIAMAFALGGGILLLLTMVCFGRMPVEKALVPMAVLAGLTVHARPHLAVGYYLTICLLCLPLVLRREWAKWKPVIAAMALLGLFGGALLASNALRFGNAATMHGSFKQDDLQYSSIFWGLESKDGARARAFTRHGQFNPARIPATALVYVASPPSGFGIDRGIAAVERVHRRMVMEGDFINISDPKAGTLFLWPAWMLLMLIGLTRRELWRMPAVAGMAGISLSALMLFSYPTITLRYHYDLWPLIALPAIFALSALGARLASPSRKSSLVPVLVVVGVFGLVFSLHKMAHSRVMNRDAGTDWTAGFCLDLTAKKGFSQERGRAICGLPPLRANP